VNPSSEPSIWRSCRAVAVLDLLRRVGDLSASARTCARAIRWRMTTATPAVNQGPFPLPSPKTFKLPNGRGSVTVPDMKKEAREVALVRTNKASGNGLSVRADGRSDGRRRRPRLLGAAARRARAGRPRAIRRSCR
jgi:hypothetical protein